MVRNTNQSQKDKEEGTSYIHRLCPVMEKLFERERDRERESAWAKEAFSSTKKRRPLAFEKKNCCIKCYAVVQ
jgi:hypothetical protein